jgi:hypothetical protein
MAKVVDIKKVRDKERVTKGKCLTVRMELSEEGKKKLVDNPWNS